MPEQDKRNISTIIWTYSAKEEATFKQMLASFGQKYEFKSRDLQLFILAQANILFRTENGQVFLRIKEGETGESGKEQYLEEIMLTKRTIFLSHNVKSVEGSEDIPPGILLDYSSADHSQHQEMMSDIDRASSEEELLRLAQQWVDIYSKNFKDELIRRAKQYVLNLFLTLSIDIRSIQNIWEKKEFDRLKELLKRLCGQWEGELSVLHSPDSQLFRFWYLLAGNDFNWEASNLRAPGDVFLPEDQYQKVAQPLWKWIKFFYGDASPEDSKAWPALIELSGLKQQGEKFAEDPSATIARFIRILRVIVKGENPHWWLQALAAKSKSYPGAKPLDYLWHLLATTDLEAHVIYQLSLGRPDYRGIENYLSKLNPTHENNAPGSFFEWLYRLNGSFDELKEEIKSLKSYEQIRSSD